MLNPSPEKMLKEKIIPFWESLKDEARGGFYGLVTARGELDREAPKGCILNSRILWFFSHCALQFGGEALRQDADHAFRALKELFWDSEFGGVFWSLDAQGKPLDDSKHTYCQAFAIYGLSAYYKLTHNGEALELAYQLRQLIEEKMRDEGGYLEAFTRDFSPASNEKLSENGVMAERTMNTLLHVFEGYTELFEAARAPEVGRSLTAILRLWLDKMYCPALRRQEVFFDREYHSLIDLHSYGHDIETSWLLDWGAALQSDRELTRQVREANSVLARRILETAYTGDSLFNECERGVNAEKRVWWVQAEGVLGFVHEWRKHPEERDMLQAARSVYAFIHSRMVEPTTGEWYNELTPDLEPDLSMALVDPWKCPYHNGRMYLKLLREGEPPAEESRG